MFPQLPALVKINQVEMNADVRIDASGSYFVQVYGVNDYYNELTFHVVNVIEDISLLSVVPISVAGVIPLLSWLLRKRFVK
jgi:beta-xylosidase